MPIRALAGRAGNIFFCAQQLRSGKNIQNCYTGIGLTKEGPAIDVLLDLEQKHR
jgi:hypothetical protein